MRKLFINLFMFSLTLNSFAYFNYKNIRLFPGIRSLFYHGFCKEQIVSKKDLDEFFKAFTDGPWKEPLKIIENNVFVAHILCYMYENKIFLKNFSEEEVIKELKKAMREVIKEGSEDALEDLCRIIKSPLAVCINAMLLLLTNTIQDYIRLCRTCEQYFKGQYKEVLKDILGRDDFFILQNYPAGLEFVPSPVKLEFNRVTLDRLKKFLNDMCKDDIFYEVIALSLESWYNLCKKIETIYKKTI